MVYLSGAGLPRLSWKNGRYMDVVVVVVVVSFLYSMIQRHCDCIETVQVTTFRRTLGSPCYSECASCHQQVHAGSKTLLQQNPSVFDCGCRLTQIVLYNCRKIVVVVSFLFHHVQ